MIKKLAVLALLASAGLAALADEAAVRAGVKAFLGEESRIEGVSRAGFLGLYEVLVATPEGTRILYTDEEARYFVFGSVIEAKSQNNFTEARLRKLNAIRFADLPLEQAVKIVRGKGTRPLAYFADPRCQYCKRFDQELTQVDDVTIYVFLLPIIAADSPALAGAVWCSPDRGKAWTDLMLKNIMPTAAAGCDTPLEKNIALSRKHGIKGTPALVFADGQRLAGWTDAARLSRLLDEAGPLAQAGKPGPDLNRPLVDKVRQALARERDLPADDIDVSAYGGVVSLWGKVSSAKESRRAEQIARRVEGVQRVENKLRVD